MNDHDLEQAFREWANEDAEVQEPARLRQRVMSVPDSEVSGSRWRWPTLAPSLRVRSFPVTASVAAVLVLFAVVLVPLVLVGPNDEEIPATDQSSIVVAADGSGQYRTIGEAVEMASDGDTILVKPGTYVESLIITKSITISGEGPREAIIVEAPDDGPVAATGEAGRVSSVDEPYAIHLIDSTARLDGLTIRGQRSRVQVSGGTPMLERLLFEGVGVIHRLTEPSAGGNALIINEGSRAIVRNNDLRGGGPIGIFDGSEPLIEGNRLSEGPNVWGSPGDAAIIRGNTFEGTEGGAIKIFGPLPGAALIEGNTIERPTGPGIVVGYQVYIGDFEPSQPLAPTIVRNVISGAETAIRISGEQVTAAVEDNLLSDNVDAIFFSQRAAGTVSRNQLVGNNTGVRVSGDVVVEGNSIEDSNTGVLVATGRPTIRNNQITGSRYVAISMLGGATPTLESNQINGNAVGLVLSGQTTSPLLIDNQLCDNDTDLNLINGAVGDLAGNTICPDVTEDGSGDDPTTKTPVDGAST